MAQSIRPAVLAAARALHSEGVYPSLSAVARRAGCMRDTVIHHRRALMAAGDWPVAVLDPGGRPAWDDPATGPPPTRRADVLAAARALHATGDYPSLAAVARRVGCHPTTVIAHRRALTAEGTWPDAGLPPGGRTGRPPKARTGTPDLSGLDLADAGPRPPAGPPIGRFGCLTVVGFDDAYTARTGKRHWRCVCSICGARSVRRADILAAGTYRKCGPGCPGPPPAVPDRPARPAPPAAAGPTPPPRSTEKASPDAEAIKALAEAIKNKTCASILPPGPKPAEAPPPPPGPASAVEEYRAEWLAMGGRTTGPGTGVGKEARHG
jgi:hypothetical protein